MSEEVEDTGAICLLQLLICIIVLQHLRKCTHIELKFKFVFIMTVNVI